jgi:hypothetical protein
MFSYSENLLRCAKDGLEKPEDFGYWGNEDTFVTWGFCGIDQNRDSKILDTCNFDVICEDLEIRFPEETRIEGFGHWAVGHVDRLVVKILKDEDLGIVEENITDVFKAAMQWKDNLQDYPVADEERYADCLFDEAIKYIEETSVKNMIDTTQLSWAESIYSELSYNMDIYIDLDAEMYPNDDDILEAAYNLFIWNMDEKESWDEWCEERGWEKIPTGRSDKNQLTLFGDDYES